MVDHTTNDSIGEIPYGYCHCGCGNLTPIAKRGNTKLGHISGKPVRFIVGHHNKIRPLIPIEKRFWEKVNKNGHGGCWEWTAANDGHGYGQIRVDGKIIKAHRMSYEMRYGPIPEGLEIAHRCDNPACVNPDHLFTATHQENMQDSIDKGRASMPPPNQVEGETNGSAEYTNAQVRAFREQFAQMNISIKKFAECHDVPVVTMWRIIRRKCYKNA